MAIRPDEAALLALFLETLLYGVFLSLFCTMIVVIRRRAFQVTFEQWFVVAVAFLMFTNATVQIILVFVYTLDGWIWSFQPVPNYVSDYYTDLTNPLLFVQAVLYVAQPFMGDTMLVWRFYVIYGNRRKLLVVPVVLVSAGSGIAILSLYHIGTARKDQTIFAAATSWVIGGLVLTMANCILCTGSIAWKIYVTGKKTTNSRTRSLWPIVLAFVESGALYTASMAATLVAYLAKSPGYYAVSAATIPLIGITFCLMVLQIRLHLDSALTVPATNTASVSPPSGQRNETSAGRDPSIWGWEMQPVAVSITKGSITRKDGAESVTSSTEDIPRTPLIV